MRFSVAKAFGEVASAVDAAVVEGEIKPILFEMEQDADADVRFYATQSLQMCENKLRVHGLGFRF